MLFVIGGSYQGKLEYVKSRFGLGDGDVFTCSKDSDIDLSGRCIYHYEQYVAFALGKGIAPVTDFRPDQIVIMDDVNCGVVPVDPQIRAWREAVGRAGSEISRHADEVVRVFCGLPKTLKSKTVKIYLLRHGKTAANRDYCYCGSSDLPLLPEGKEELAAKRARVNYPDVSALRCYTSGLTRTKETFEVLFPGQKAEAKKEFDEMDFGDFELRKYDNDLQSDPDFVIWTGGNNETNVCPHGESSLMMKRRVLAGFEELLAKGEDALIVSHGGPITEIFRTYIPDSGLNYYEIQPKNGEGYMLEFEGSRVIKYTKITEQEQ